MQESILLVQPDPTLREEMARFLTAEDFRVSAVEDCQEAVQRGATIRPDLFLCGLSRRDPTGLEAFAELRRAFPSLAGVALTGYDNRELVTEALRAGFTGFVFTPFESLELVSACRAALEQEKLRQEHARLRALVPLYDLSRTFMASRELPEVLDQIVMTAHAETHAEVVSLMLLEDDGESLMLAAASGLDPALVGTESALGIGIAGWVATHGQPLMLADDLPLERPLREAMAKPELLSALSLPLQTRGETIGVLNLARRRGGEPFTQGDLELATVLAGQAAIAIDQARLIQGMRDLTETSQRLASALDLDEAAGLIIETTARLASAREAAFWLVEEVSDQLVLFKPFGLPADELGKLTPPSSELLTAEPFTVEPEHGRLWLPIVRAGTHFGLIELRRAGRGPLRPDRLGLLRAYAHTAAAVIESHRLRAREAIAFRELGEALRSDLNLKQVLERVLSQMVEACGASGGSIFLVGEHAPQPEAFVSNGLPAPEAIARQVMQDREGVLLARVTQPELRGIRSVIGVPLTIGSRVEGAVVLHHRQAGGFAARHLNLASVLANSTALLIRNAQLYARSEEAVIGEERTRIAREIHDGLAQDLSLLVLKVEIMRRLMQRGDWNQLEKEMDEMAAALRNDAREVRRTIFALRPIDLEALGFVPALEKFTQEFGASNDVQILLQIAGDASTLSPKVQTALFRLAQESLNNIRKHARATAAHIEIAIDDNWATLTVRDDGRGFDPDGALSDARRRGSVGMVQMRERAERAGGSFELESAPGQGTIIRVRLPLK